MFKRNKAFTLVELLVVLSIVSLLVVVAATNIQVSRADARDGKRMSEVSSLSKAFELYYTDYGEYPKSEDWQCIEEYENFGLIMARYLPDQVKDPLYNSDSSHCYLLKTTNGEQNYKIQVELESGPTHEVYSAGGREIE